MTTEKFSPTNITPVTAGGSFLGSVSNIQDDVDNYMNDSTFLVPTGSSSIAFELTFPSPSSNLDGIQTFRVAIEGSSSFASPDNNVLRIQEGARILTTVTYDPAISERYVYEGSIDASELNDPSGADLYFEVYMGYNRDSMVFDRILSADVTYNYVVPSTVPPTFSNLSPADQYTTNNYFPSFSALVSDADTTNEVKLVVEVSQTSDLSSGVSTFESPSVLQGNSTTAVSDFLMNSGVWYWRAKAVDSGGMESAYSAIRQLTINNNAPNAPTNITPADSSEIASTMPEFTASLSDIDGNDCLMEVDISTDSGFSNIISTLQSTYVNSGLTATVVQSSPLNAGTYYWRARTYDREFYSSYSATRTLLLVNSEPIVSNITPSSQTRINANNIDVTAVVNDSDGDTSKLTLELSQQSDFSNATILESGFQNSGTTHTINTGSLANGAWYWRLYATDSKGAVTAYTNTRILYIEVPVLQRLAPDSILESQNVSGSVSNIQDDPDSPDSLYLGGDSLVDTVLRVGFAPPDEPLTGTQEFRVLARMNGGSSGTFSISLYENGSLISSSGTFSCPANSTTVSSYTWDASVLSDITGAGVECRLIGVGVYGGSPSGRVAMDFGAVEWNSTREFNAGTVTIENPPSVTITDVTLPKISDETGFNSSDVTFTFDQDIVEWVVRVGGNSESSGFLADGLMENVPSNTPITATIDWTEGLVEGENQVNIYGKTSGGMWSEYNS